MGAPPDPSGMELSAVLLQGGALTEPPALLLGVALLALIILVGRFLLSVAWKLVIIALIVLGTLWILGILGFEFGIFGMVGPVLAG